MSMKKIYLHGYLNKYGRVYNLDVATPAEAVHAIGVQIKGFRADIRRGEFRVMRGKKNLKNAIDETELTASFGTSDELHIVPVAVGSKNNGVLKVILGVALIGVGWGVSAGALSTGGVVGANAALFGIKAGTYIAMGAGMLTTGIGSLLSPTASLSGATNQDEKQSYLFSGTQNLTSEGNIIPCAYGKKVWCGSLVLSAGMDVQEVDS